MNILDMMLDHSLNNTRKGILKQDISFRSSQFDDEVITFEKGTVADILCKLPNNQYHFEYGNFAIVVSADEIDIQE